LAGTTITVDGSLYVNHADLVDPTTTGWTLNLTSANGAPPSAIDGDQTDPIDFGDPYAVVFNASVSYGDVTGLGWVAAATPVSSAALGGRTAETNNNVTNVAGNIGNWSFDRVRVTDVTTLFDNVIEVTFNQDIENDNDEIEAYFNTDGNAVAQYIRLDNGNARFTDVYTDFSDPANPSYTSGDENVFYFVTADATWNTDATAASAGDTAAAPPGNYASTDRYGVAQTAKPDLTFPKAFLFGADGRNPNKNYNENGFELFDGGEAGTTTADQTSPALVAVEAGRAPHERGLTDAQKQPYDGHNFFRLRYSEPVDIGGLTGGAGIDVNDLSADNQRAESTFSAAGDFGGHMTDNGTSSPPSGSTENLGTVEVVGYFSYPGSFIPGTRDGNIVTNLLYRAVGDDNPNGVTENEYGRHGLAIYVSSYSDDGSGGAVTGSEDRVWPGYMYGHSFATVANRNTSYARGRPENYPFNITDPAGEFASVPTNANIVDAAGNQLEPSNSPFDNAGVPSFTSDKGNPTITAISVDWGTDVNLPSEPSTSLVTGWDYVAPGFSTLDPPLQLDAQGSREIVTDINPTTNLIVRLDFFMQDNFVTEDGYVGETDTWIPEDDHVLDSPRHGIRDISLFYPGPPQERDSLLVGELGDATLSNAFNQSLRTSVANFLFSPDGNPANSPNRPDDPYLSLDVDNPAWTNLTPIEVSYDETSAFLTDLAGNLLPSTPDRISAVERVPPRIDLSLIRVGTDRMYVRFSESIVAYGTTGDPDTSASIETFDPNNLFTLENVDGITIDDIEIITPAEEVTTGNDFDAWFTLSGPIDANDALDGRIRVAAADKVYDNLQNSMLADIAFPLSDIAIGAVEPVLAADQLREYGDFGEDFTSIRDFTGAGTGLLPGPLQLQAQINADDHFDDLLRLYYDIAPSPDTLVVDDSAVEFWLPSPVPGYNEVFNPEAESVLPYTRNEDGSLRTFQIPEDDEMSEGADVEFVLRIGERYAARLADEDDPRTLAPFLIPMRGVIEQRSGVSIFNNVINPTIGDKAYLSYELPNSGVVRVMVFTLNGDVVRVFHSGRQAAGSYTYAWDGTNQRGQIVARGVYFVRVVGPDFDEYRKVMVVK